MTQLARRSIALLICVVAPAVAGCGSAGSPSEAPGSSSPGSTVGPSPTVIATAVGPAPGAAWQRSTPVSGPRNAAMYDVAAYRGAFVAVGGAPTTGGLVWTSPDGISWALLQPADVDDGGAMISVLALADRLVAVGRRLDTAADTAAAWTSAVGGTWTMVDGGAAFEGAQIIRATRFGTGLVAVGSAPPQDAAAAWLSADGTAWERVADSPAFEGAFLWTVAATPGGTGLIAGGWRRDGNADPEAAIWTSVDGRSWVLSPGLPGAAGMQIRSIAIGAGRFVAGGEAIGGGRAGAWTSEDAIVWTETTDESFDGASIVSVAAGGPGLVAVGTHNVDDAAGWTSPDGISWDLVASDPALEDAYFTSVVAAPDRLVGVGALQRRIPGSQSYESTPIAWLSLATN